MPQPKKNVKKTPLYNNHVAAGGRMVDFAGYSLPVQYESIIAEHNHCRQHTALFDTSHMGQLLITGPKSAAELSAAVTQDAVKLPVGRGKYGFILTNEGGIVDDTILMKLADNEFLLIVNAATCQNDINILRSRMETSTIKHLTDWAKLDIQGPESFEVMKNFTNIDLADLKFFGNTRCKVNGHDAVLSRTGYTGELGYEVFMPAEFLPDFFDALVKIPNVKPAGLGARDSLRLEMCYPLYGHELSENITPAEADMTFFFDASRNFTGSAAAIASPQKKLIAIAGESRRQFHPGDKILHNGKPVGLVTSGAFSPSLNVAIGMGYVETSAAEDETTLEIKTTRATLPAKITKKPLYTNSTCRMKLSN